MFVGFKNPTYVCSIAAHIQHRCSVFFGKQHGHHIGYQLGFFAVAHFHDIALLELADGAFHHADGAAHQRVAGGDYRFGLLFAQHGLGDFGRVGQVGEAGFVDADARAFDPLLHHVAELLENMLGMAGQAFGIFGGVGVVGGQRAQGGLALHLHKIVDVFHIEHGGGGVADVVNDGGGERRETLWVW